MAVAERLMAAATWSSSRLNPHYSLTARSRTASDSAGERRRWTQSARRSPLVQGRDHLRAARPRLLRQQRRRHRRLRRPDPEARLPRRTWASPRSGCCRSIPSPRKDDGYDIADYTNVNPDYGTLRDVKRPHPRGPPPRPARHHRAGLQPHLRPAPVVPARAGRPRAAPSATSTSGATTPTSGATRGSSSRTSNGPTGPGIRSPTRTTGTASTPTSRT